MDEDGPGDSDRARDAGVIGKLPPKGRGRWHWRSWNDRSAYGVGTIWIDNCQPDCARGSFYSHRGSVLASRVRRGHFTRMKLRFRYRGHTVTDRRALSQVAGNYFWSIVT